MDSLGTKHFIFTPSHLGSQLNFASSQDTEFSVDLGYPVDSIYDDSSFGLATDEDFPIDSLYDETEDL